LVDTAEDVLERREIRALATRDDAVARPRNRQLHDQGCARRTSSSTSAPQPGAVGIVSLPSAISGTAVVSCSRQGTSSTSTSRMRTFGIAAHHCAEMKVARWL